MTARAAALVLAAAAAALPARAAADPIDLGPARLSLDDRWTGAAVDPAIDPAVLLAVPLVRTAGAAHLVVVRHDVPNTEAWRERTRQAHADAIVAGFAATPGTIVVEDSVRRLGRANVPVLDLALRRGAEHVAVRVLLFRTFTLAAIAAAPERATAARAATSLAPE